MKRYSALLLAIVFAFASVPSFAQSSRGSVLSRLGGVYYAGAYTQWKTSIASGAAAGTGVTLVLHNGFVALPDGRNIIPFSSSIPLTIGVGANAETATPSAVSGCTINAPLDSCSITITTSNAHGQGDLVTSGDFGIAEASSDAATNGGGVVAYHLHELLTLATGTTTTDTTAKLEPANGLLLGVSGVVNTTITGSCTGWELGDATTAGRFTANDTTLTAGEKKIGTVQMTTGVANATTGFVEGGTATSIRVTCAGGNPSAGKIDISSWGLIVVAPNS